MCDLFSFFRRSTVILEHSYCIVKKSFDAKKYHEALVYHYLRPEFDLEEPLLPDFIPEVQVPKVTNPQKPKVIHVRSFDTLAVTQHFIPLPLSKRNNDVIKPVICCDQEGNLYEEDANSEDEATDEEDMNDGNEFYDLSVRERQDFNLLEVDFVAE